MKSFPLEQLPNETIIKVIGQLSLWDALALEATNKRMHDLVRAHQKVQTFVDLTFPMRLEHHKSAWEFKKGFEKVLLTRFGPNLLNIKEMKGWENFYTRTANYHNPLYNYETFIRRFAIACPNLIELQANDMPALIAYAGSRSVALTKIVMRQGSLSSAQVESFIKKCPQLEDLTIGHDQFKNWDGSLIRAVEASLPLDNKIRRLELCYNLDHETTQIQVMKRFISKVPRLEHFNLKVYGCDQDPLHADLVLDLFAMIKCSKSLEEETIVHADKFPSTLATLMTRIKIGGPADDINEALMKLTNLKQLEIRFWPLGYQQVTPRPVLVIPQTVRELELVFLSQSAEVNSIVGCIRNQGKQLESIALLYHHYYYLSEGLYRRNELLWTNQILNVLSESSTTLKSLYFQKPAHLYGFDSEHLRTFVRTCGKYLEHFHVDNQLLSLSTLRLISTECKSLASFNFSFSIEKKKDKSQIIKMKKLLKGMANLFEANVAVKHFNETINQWEYVAQCAYANCKFMVYRQ